MFLSIVVPVYNRPEEVEDLLHSLVLQDFKDFEVVIVEDGSQVKSDIVVKKFSDTLVLTYLEKTNSGPGLSRNYGSHKCQGDYIVYLDSDIIVPQGYTQVLYDNLKDGNIDVFGGPDAASEDFTDMQKAVTYAMTSFFTTGGIRGGGKKLDRFFPRSFNMGYKRDIFKQTGGFSHMRFGEDIELSYRLFEKGYNVALIPEAFVYHKRRTSTKAFFKQVFFSGMTRINLYLRFPSSLKKVHILPSLFVLGSIFAIILTLFVHRYFIIPLILIILIWLVDATFKYNSLNIGILSVKTSLVQLTGYGTGFLFGIWKRLIKKEDENSTFNIKFINKYF